MPFGDELGAADIDRLFVEGDDQVDLGFHRGDRLPRGTDRRVGVTAADPGQDVPVGVDVQVLAAGSSGRGGPRP